MTPSEHSKQRGREGPGIPRFPDDDLRVDFGKPAPGSSNPMPEEVRAAYEERILNSTKAQGAMLPPDCRIR